MLNGVGHDYDFVVVLISSQSQTMSLEDAHMLFFMHEKRIEHLNTYSPAAHFASCNTGYNNKDNACRGSNNGGNSRGNKSRGRSGRHLRKSNQRINCQLCSKPGHGACNAIEGLINSSKDHLLQINKL
ncbi:hypothetical protein ACOSP7_004256 [Xanthoceras sorbifolium]